MALRVRLVNGRAVVALRHNWSLRRECAPTVAAYARIMRSHIAYTSSVLRGVATGGTRLHCLPRTQITVELLYRAVPHTVLYTVPCCLLTGTSAKEIGTLRFSLSTRCSETGGRWCECLSGIAQRGRTLLRERVFVKRYCSPGSHAMFISARMSICLRVYPPACTMYVCLCFY